MNGYKEKAIRHKFHSIHFESPCIYNDITVQDSVQVFIQKHI